MVGLQGHPVEVGEPRTFCKAISVEQVRGWIRDDGTPTGGTGSGGGLEKKGLATLKLWRPVSTIGTKTKIRQYFAYPPSKYTCELKHQWDPRRQIQEEGQKDKTNGYSRPAV